MGTFLSCGVAFIFGAFFGLFAQRLFYGTAAGEKCILDLLASSREPLYGLEMVNLSAGLLKRGTIYVLLSRLEDRGLITSTDAGRNGRRLYRLNSTPVRTDKGQS